MPAREPLRPPRALLLDYGGTLVEEAGYDPRAGNAALLARAAHRPPHVTLEHVLERAHLVSAAVAARRDEFQIETPWPALTRLIYDYLGITFADPLPELEMAFWHASVTTRAMPGAREALAELHRAGLPIAVVSNASFGPDVIRSELAKHELADHLAFVMVSADYAVRKPNPLLFDTAAARLGLPPHDIWFVGDRLDTDVAGACAAGMVAVWLRPTGATAPADDAAARPDLTVATWPDLVAHVRRALP